MTTPPEPWSEYLGRRAAWQEGEHPAGSTAPMQPYRDPPPPTVDSGRTPARSTIGRFVVTLAGLLAAGSVILGVGLMVLMVVVPRLRTGTGINASTGPGWGRAAFHLGVGVVAEGALAWGRRRPWSVSVTVGALAVVAVLAVLAAAWWI